MSEANDLNHLLGQVALPHDANGYRTVAKPEGTCKPAVCDWLSTVARRLGESQEGGADWVLAGRAEFRNGARWCYWLAGLPCPHDS